jgi:hypothetical protein
LSSIGTVIGSGFTTGAPVPTRLPAARVPPTAATAVTAAISSSDRSPTREVWYYDYRTNVHHTLKKKPLRYEDLADFVRCYNPANRHDRKATWSEETPEGRWRRFGRDEKARSSRAIRRASTWLKDKSLTDLDNLPEPDELAEEIIDNLEAGLQSLRSVLVAPPRRVKAVGAGARFGSRSRMLGSLPGSGITQAPPAAACRH